MENGAEGIVANVVNAAMGNQGGGAVPGANNPTPGPNPGGGGGGEKTPMFTPEQQAHINKIVSQRVNEEKAKYKDYDDVVQKARVFEGILKDPSFQTWLETGEVSTGGNGRNGGGGQSNPYENIEDVQDLLKVLPNIIEQTLRPMLKPFEQTAANLQMATKVTAMNTELQRMSSALDEQGNYRYPGLSDPGFRAEVERIIGEGRAWKLDDAYALASADRRAGGKEVPSSAFLLQTRLGGGGGGGGRGPQAPDFSDAPALFKNPAEAMELVMRKLGYK
jgi:hypothetical protein